MPTLPPVPIQVLRGINGKCFFCRRPIDKRSLMCRRCHQACLMVRRYPLRNRPILVCSFCGGPVSRKAGGNGRKKRCGSCYQLQRCNNRKPKRSTERPFGGTTYVDQDGNVRYALEYLEDGAFTVAAGWACLRRCWLGFKIAKSKGDFYKMIDYAKAIQSLQQKLNIPGCNFSGLLLETRSLPNLQEGSDHWHQYSSDVRSNPPFTCPAGSHTQ